MNKIISLVSAFLLLLFITPFVFAQEMNYGDHIVLPKNAVINAPYFAGGQGVTVDGTINGDAYVAGGDVLIEGNVNGDLLVAGGNVIIRGTVLHNVRAAGGNITISGKVGGNVTVVAGNVTVADSADIAGDLVAGSGDVKIFGPVGKNVVAGAGNLTIGQKISGNVVTCTQYLNLGSGAHIAGDLTYYSGQKAGIQEGATILGKTTFHQTVSRRPQEVAKTAGAAAGSAWLFAKTISFLSSLVLGLLFVSFIPIFSLQAAGILQKNLWASIGIGLLMLILIPIIMLILAVTIIGLPLAMFVLFLFLFIMFVSKLVVSLWVGQRVLGYWQKKPHNAWSLVVGLILWVIFTSIPVIGGLFGLLTLLAGMGALYLQRKTTYEVLRSRKII